MIKDFHDLNLKCDFLLLPNVFKKFRNSSVKSYELCRSHYLSASTLSWDAMPNVKKVELEFIADDDMFFEKYMRGGVFQEIHQG